VSSVSEAANVEKVGRPAGRVIATVVLVVIGIVCIVAAIMYFSEPAKSLPSILGTIKYNGHNAVRANDKRSVRGIVALVVGVILLVAGWFAFAWKSKNKTA
jgi:uncharacterized membrane protein HdeD (DUF308 family)